LNIDGVLLYVTVTDSPGSSQTVTFVVVKRLTEFFATWLTVPPTR